MSYCRWENSFFYIYGVKGGDICIRGRDGTCRTVSKPEALKYLTEIKEKGKKVSSYVIERLKREIEEESKIRHCPRCEELGEPCTEENPCCWCVVEEIRKEDAEMEAEKNG